MITQLVVFFSNPQVGALARILNINAFPNIDIIPP
jgi:hypothetical protein